MKYKKLLVLNSLFLLFFLSACSADKSEKKNSINIFIDVRNAETVDIIKKITDDYKSKNPEISVNVISASGADTDIIFTTRTNMIELANKGGLTNMKNYIEANKIEERYNNIVKVYGRYNDKTYGIPVILNPLEIYFNIDALEKMNLNPPGDITGVNRILAALKSKSIEIPVIINEENNIKSIVFSFILNNEADTAKLDKNFDAGFEAYKNITEMKIPFDTLKGMVKKNIIGKDSFVKGSNADISKLGKGEIPAVIASIGNTTEINKTSIKVFDNFNKGIIPIASEMIISVPVSGKNPKQAEDFIKYIFSDATQRNLQEMGFITGNKAIGKDAKGVEGAINSQLEMADGKNIIYTDAIPDKLLRAVETRLELILSGKFEDNEWDEALKNAY